MSQQSSRLEFIVPDMMCGSCVKKITMAVHGLDPSAIVDANLETKQVNVTTLQPQDAIWSAMDAVGFEVVIA